MPREGMYSDISVEDGFILVECDHEYLSIESAREMVEDLIAAIKELEEASDHQEGPPA